MSTPTPYRSGDRVYISAKRQLGQSSGGETGMSEGKTRPYQVVENLGVDHSSEG